MKNLAGHPQSTELFTEELRNARIPTFPVDIYGEVKCRVVGQIALPLGYLLTVRRLWCYASVEITPALPVEIARHLNNLPFDGGGTKYSGANRTLGSVVRADGYAGGLPTSSVKSTEFWHIDAWEAWAPFYDALKRMIPKYGIPAADSLSATRREWTEEMLSEVGKLGSGTFLWKIVAKEFLRSDKTDWTRPGAEEFRVEAERILAEEANP